MPGKGLEFACEQTPREKPDAVLKALGSLESTEEKLAALCKKYADLLEENRLLQQKFKQSQKSLSVIMKEKDQLQSDHGKAILAKSKLESLCRELQRHNKLIKDESIGRAKEEEEKRKEISNSFQTTITDIQTKMTDHHKENTKLREANIELNSKMKTLMEQYEVREQHIEKLFKHKELEGQLSDARLEQVNLQLNETKEKSKHEREVLIAEAVEARSKVQVLEEQEKQLRAQVALYTDKYEEFQQTLSKSNEVFQSFKSEMEKMTKKIQKLEKETQMWKKRWENSNKALLEMAEEKTKSDHHKKQLNAKISKLESLCRALQEDRRKSATPNGVEASASNTTPSKQEDVKLTKTPPNTPEQHCQSPTPEHQNHAEASETKLATSDGTQDPTSSAPSESNTICAHTDHDESAKETQPTDDSSVKASEPATQVSESAPAEQAGVTPESAPAEQAGVTPESAPAEQAGVTPESAPAEQAGVTPESAPTEQAAVTSESAPAEQAGVTPESAPTEQAAVTSESAPTEQAAVTSESAPAEQI